MPPPQIPKFNNLATFPSAQRHLRKYRNGQPQPDEIKNFDRPESSLSPQPRADLLKYRFEAANCTGTMDDVIETMMNTARWLAKARCTESVDLFCDVARMFSPRDPPANMSDEKYSLIRAVCDAMFDIDDIGIESSSPIDRDSDGDGILNTINWEYFIDAAASRRSLMSDLQLRMAAKCPISPAHMHGHRLSSHGSIRRGRKGKRMINKRARSEIALPKSLAHRQDVTLPADPSNWAANHTSPFGEAFREELDREEESMTYQQLKMICEEGVKARSRAARSQVAQVQLTKENETPMKQKRRSLSFHCTGKQASAMILEALMKDEHEDTAPEAQEKEKPVVFERKPMAKEQLDKNPSTDVCHTSLLSVFLLATTCMEHLLAHPFQSGPQLLSD
ncbi:hypothetical protein EMCG_05122 [[Emmonsia] crescens]|uniref:Uncharacterized protein n=1 Tax=[Emmonsia] crescens TaxID=73230 RepID=A0A0G2HR78_9EURO|nr:hypothetical protein EMCG_05122 [Emmonsia crescens UAMH 3008]